MMRLTFSGAPVARSRAAQTLFTGGNLPSKVIDRPLVIIESPFGGGKDGKDLAEREKNIQYLRACLRDSLLKGEAPFASHGLYTQDGVLNDDAPEERALGIAAGLAWRRAANKTVVYTDRGISKGMEYGIKAAEEAGNPVEYRSLNVTV